MVTIFACLFAVLGLLCTVSTIFAGETDTTDRCNSIAIENAATILLVSPDDLQKSTIDVMVSPDDITKKTFKTPPYKCSIRSKSDFLIGISYIVYIYNDIGPARIDFNKMLKSYGIISKVDTVADIGDETFWAGDNRFQRMVSIKGNIVIDVLSPKDFKLQNQIIRLVLSEF